MVGKKMSKYHLSLLPVPKQLSIFNGVFVRRATVIYVYSDSFFFKYKFNSNLGGVISNGRILKVYSINYSLFKTYHKLLQNIFNDVSENYTYRLDIVGLGFKQRMLKGKLYFILGYSHLICVKIPGNISINLTKKHIIMSSYDRVLLKQFFFKLRLIRPLDAYKAKGLRLQNEALVIKKGKQSSY